MEQEIPAGNAVLAVRESELFLAGSASAWMRVDESSQAETRFPACAATDAAGTAIAAVIIAISDKRPLSSSNKVQRAARRPESAETGLASVTVKLKRRRSKAFDRCSRLVKSG